MQKIKQMMILLFKKVRSGLLVRQQSGEAEPCERFDVRIQAWCHDDRKERVECRMLQRSLENLR